MALPLTPVQRCTHSTTNYARLIDFLQFHSICLALWNLGARLARRCAVGRRWGLASTTVVALATATVASASPAKTPAVSAATIIIALATLGGAVAFSWQGQWITILQDATMKCEIVRENRLKVIFESNTLVQTQSRVLKEKKTCKKQVRNTAPFHPEGGPYKLAICMAHSIISAIPWIKFWTGTQFTPSS